MRAAAIARGGGGPYLWNMECRMSAFPLLVVERHLSGARREDKQRLGITSDRLVEKQHDASVLTSAQFPAQRRRGLTALTVDGYMLR